MSQSNIAVREQAAAPKPDTGVAQRASRAQLLRPVLMIGGIFLVAIGALAFWLLGGRYVSSDDTYVNAAKVSLSTSVSALVSEVDVRDNQHVTAGQVLFRLDPSTFNIAVAAATAQLREAVLNVSGSKHSYAQAVAAIQEQQAQVDIDTANLRRYGAVVGNGGVTRAVYETAQYTLAADQARLAQMQASAGVQLSKLGDDPHIDPVDTPSYQNALANLNAAKQNLAYTVVRAPFSGYVTEVEQLQPGMYLTAGTAAFGLVSDSDVWIETQPKETQLTWVRPGQSVDIGIDTYPAQKWTGVVDSMGPASGSSFSILPAQNSSGNWVKVVQRVPIRIKITSGPQDFVLRDGMSATISIDTQHRRHLF